MFLKIKKRENRGVVVKVQTQCAQPRGMLRTRRSIVRPCTVLRAAFDRRAHLSAGKSQYLRGEVGVTFWRESLHADASL